MVPYMVPFMVPCEVWDVDGTICGTIYGTVGTIYGIMYGTRKLLRHMPPTPFLKILNPWVLQNGSQVTQDGSRLDQRCSKMAPKVATKLGHGSQSAPVCGHGPMSTENVKKDDPAQKKGIPKRHPKCSKVAPWGDIRRPYGANM